MMNSPALRSLLCPTAIELGATVSSPEEAIQMAGNLLVASGGATDAYVEHILQAFKELGPYMVIAPGLAMPHARPDGSVLKPCVGLLTLRAPVAFGHPSNDPVSVIMALGGTTDESHLALLGDLARFLGVEGIVERLSRVGTYADVTALINESEGME